ncbi:unnamed protein product [Mytilus coruscus]|uniref:Uncharacterized protein n=1 Tax=Mytilus coruscus TaxID=42192 RepID=A0A6J8D7I8_MYTCO|nr:unnamed protein product [Mytilus coruscus]
MVFSLDADDVGSDDDEDVIDGDWLVGTIGSGELVGAMVGLVLVTDDFGVEKMSGRLSILVIKAGEMLNIIWATPRTTTALDRRATLKLLDVVGAIKFKVSYKTTDTFSKLSEADLKDRQAFNDEVARRKIRWDMVDGQRPQKLLDTLNATNKNNFYVNIAVHVTPPLAYGYSPVDLLMGRKPRTLVPLAPENLAPKLPNTRELSRKEGEYILNKNSIMTNDTERVHLLHVKTIVMSTSVPHNVRMMHADEFIIKVEDANIDFNDIIKPSTTASSASINNREMMKITHEKTYLGICQIPRLATALKMPFTVFLK